MKIHRQPPPGPLAELAPWVPAFDPVPVRARRDGWTPVRQLAFLVALSASACVEEACRFVGMSARTAYRLRARPDAESFAQAWDAVITTAVERVADAAVGRALAGVATPILYKGRHVGERRSFDNRLAMFILSRHLPNRYGAAAEGRGSAYDAS